MDLAVGHILQISNVPYKFTDEQISNSFQNRLKSDNAILFNDIRLIRKHDEQIVVLFLKFETPTNMNLAYDKLNNSSSAGVTLNVVKINGKSESNQPKTMECKSVESDVCNEKNVPLVYVGNLNAFIDCVQLKRKFEKFGCVNDVFVGRDRKTKVSKRFGIVTYASHCMAKRAVNALNNGRWHVMKLGVSLITKMKADELMQNPDLINNENINGPHELIHTNGYKNPLRPSNSALNPPKTINFSVKKPKMFHSTNNHNSHKNGKNHNQNNVISQMNRLPPPPPVAPAHVSNPYYCGVYGMPRIVHSGLQATYLPQITNIAQTQQTTNLNILFPKCTLLFRNLPNIASHLLRFQLEQSAKIPFMKFELLKQPGALPTAPVNAFAVFENDKSMKFAYDKLTGKTIHGNVINVVFAPNSIDHQKKPVTQMATVLNVPKPIIIDNSGKGVGIVNIEKRSFSPDSSRDGSPRSNGNKSANIHGKHNGKHNGKHSANNGNKHQRDKPRARARKERERGKSISSWDGAHGNNRHRVTERSRDRSRRGNDNGRSRSRGRFHYSHNNGSHNASHNGRGRFVLISCIPVKANGSELSDLSPRIISNVVGGEINEICKQRNGLRRSNSDSGNKLYFFIKFGSDTDANKAVSKLKSEPVIAGYSLCAESISRKDFDSIL